MADGRDFEVEAVNYQAFEDLPVWQAAMDLARRSFNLVSSGMLKGHPGLRDQLERAVVSSSNNIAEGYERGTHEELLTFLYYAKGSAGEVRSMLRLLESGDSWTEWSAEVESLTALSLSVSRQIAAWLNSLRNSDAKGPRYSSEASRQAASEVERRERFREYLREVAEAKSQGLVPPPFKP